MRCCVILVASRCMMALGIFDLIKSGATVGRFFASSETTLLLEETPMTEAGTSTNSIHRRAVLAGLAVSAVSGGIATMVSAQPSAADAAKGPKVWLDMDQQELDDAYDPTKY